VLEVVEMGEIVVVDEPNTRPAIESRPGSTVIRDKLTSPNLSGPRGIRL
jgi:hypothetical protein